MTPVVAALAGAIDIISVGIFTLNQYLSSCVDAMSEQKLSYFVHQIRIHHYRTPSRCAAPLHYDSKIKNLVEFSWPCDAESGQRIPPSMLQEHQQSHDFRPPCCLCSFLDDVDYTESVIGIVDTGSNTSAAGESNSTMNGQYVALCSRRRCGYVLCLERFYLINGLRLQVNRKRDLYYHLDWTAPESISPSQELNCFSDTPDLGVSVPGHHNRGGPLFQLMVPAPPQHGEFLQPILEVPAGLCELPAPSNLANYGHTKPKMSEKSARKFMRDLMHGMAEDIFCRTFAQCLICKAVVMQKGMALHRCSNAGSVGNHSSQPPSANATNNPPRRRIFGSPSSAMARPTSHRAQVHIRVNRATGQVVGVQVSHQDPGPAQGAYRLRPVVTNPEIIPHSD
ncbi:hypothetical protein NMY22_g799 [Coprinellus aureogranulatus]|nr:hypothetical protein NMY22_g799 [Coprinellus aureogranulatus]